MLVDSKNGLLFHCLTVIGFILERYINCIFYGKRKLDVAVVPRLNFGRGERERLE